MNAYLGIGANLGPRERSILEALRRIDAGGGTRVVRTSALYECDAVGMGLAPPFINAVTQVHALLSPGDLLKRVKAVERAMGRSGGHNRPREIDIDLIAVGDRLIDTPDLTLPHPRYDERAFVLIPLREIAPRFVCPRTGRSIDELAGRLTGTAAVRRVSGRALFPRVET